MAIAPLLRDHDRSCKHAYWEPPSLPSSRIGLGSGLHLLLLFHLFTSLTDTPISAFFNSLHRPIPALGGVYVTTNSTLQIALLQYYVKSIMARTSVLCFQTSLRPTLSLSNQIYMSTIEDSPVSELQEVVLFDYDVDPTFQRFTSFIGYCPSHPRHIVRRY